MVQGHIYVITNKITGKQYVGQTSRNIETRFEEHCYDDRSTSHIHNAIKKYGVSNFEIKELETVELNKLDEREQYWIKELNTYKDGYNQNVGGDQSLNNHNQILIVENGFLVDSKEYLAREMSRITDWSLRFLSDKLATIIDTEKDLCGYHFKTTKCYREELTDIIDLENWAKKLNIQFQGQCVYCLELDKEFETTGQMARYLIDNGYYTGNSTQPIQGVIALIGRLIKENKTSEFLNNFHFYKTPKTTKQINSGNQNPFNKKAVYCPELDKQFESCIECAKYLVENNIWKDIKVKTARCRISDILNGIFENYRGLTFKEI